MATTGRTSGGFMENAYRLLFRRTSVYVTFVLTGAIIGERVVDYGMNKIWEANNVGKRYEDIPNLGSKAEPAEDE
ncbi:unnamed protein product [Calypogeia fissa]